MAHYFSLFLLLVFFTSSCRLHPVIPTAVRSRNAPLDLQGIYDMVPCSFDHPLTLQEMISIAVENNLDLLAQAYEVAVHNEENKKNLLLMLPSLTPTYNSTHQSNIIASFSKSLDPLIPPAPLSTSTDETISIASSQLSWGLIDFGAAYFKSREERGVALVNTFIYEKMRQKLIADLATNYWKAYATKSALTDGQKTVDLIENNKERLKDRMLSKWISDLEGLDAINKLTGVEMDLVRFEKGYHEAILQLGLLMGLPPCVEFEISMSDPGDAALELAPAEDLARLAFYNRPELFQKDMEEVVAWETMRGHMMQMIPGFRYYISPQYNSNTFLLNRFWWQVGITALWDILRLPAYYQEQKALQRGKEKVVVERMALTLAVMSQVYMAHVVAHDYLREYEVAKSAYEAKENLYQAVAKRVNSGEMHEADAIVYQANAVLGKLQMLEAFYNLQRAYEQLNTAVGIPEYYSPLNQTEIES